MKLSIKDVSCASKLVLVRCDLNVPLDNDGKITDDTRIRASIPTIQHLKSLSPKGIFLCSHLGRPKDGPDPKLSLSPVAERLSALLNEPVVLVSDCIGEPVTQAVSECDTTKIFLLENTRFYKEESKNDPDFASKVSRERGAKRCLDRGAALGKATARVTLYLTYFPLASLAARLPF